MENLNRIENVILNDRTLKCSIAGYSMLIAIEGIRCVCDAIRSIRQKPSAMPIAESEKHAFFDSIIDEFLVRDDSGSAQRNVIWQKLMAKRDVDAEFAEQLQLYGITRFNSLGYRSLITYMSERGRGLELRNGMPAVLGYCFK